MIRTVKDVCIKQGTYCPICKGMPLADCWHSADEFQSTSASYRFDVMSNQIVELKARIAELEAKDERP